MVNQKTRERPGRGMVSACMFYREKGGVGQPGELVKQSQLKEHLFHLRILEEQFSQGGCAALSSRAPRIPLPHAANAGTPGPLSPPPAPSAPGWADCLSGAAVLVTVTDI